MSEEVRITSSTGGQKGSKPERYDLIPVGPLAHVARVYGEGAKKYDDRNWEKGYAWSLSYAALQRHLNAMWGGEWLDPETGVPHLACAVFHAFTLLEFHETHPEFDDRPKRRVLPGHDEDCEGCGGLETIDPATVVRIKPSDLELPQSIKAHLLGEIERDL